MLLIGLGISGTKIQHLKFSKTGSEVWDKPTILFGSKAQIVHSNLKQQLFRCKMGSCGSMSSHINTWRSLLSLLAPRERVDEEDAYVVTKVWDKVDEEDAIVMLLNSLILVIIPHCLHKVNYLTSPSESMVSSLFVEEKCIGVN